MRSVPEARDASVRLKTTQRTLVYLVLLRAVPITSVSHDPRYTPLARTRNLNRCSWFKKPWKDGTGGLVFCHAPPPLRKTSTRNWKQPR